MMRTRWRRPPGTLPAAALLLLTSFGPSAEPPAARRSRQDAARPATSLDDRRLARLRQAAAAWELRSGPDRVVVDQVCLVRDADEFFEAVASWDDRHYFPVLIEDAEYTLKFLRAFRPSRIVRMPDDRGEAIGATDRWGAALEAVGRSWVGPDEEVPPGDRRPVAIRSAPTGVVLSNPEAPMLAGAVALAAGRAQPLVRWEPAGGFGDLISMAEAEGLARDLERRVGAVAGRYDALADDCDFLTLALDYPYRYEGTEERTFQPGKAAVDDLLGRVLDVPAKQYRPRWAYTGRLLGGDRQSVYRAMCALFLRPERVAFFDTYRGGDPYRFYESETPAGRLGDRVAVARRQGEGADAGGWYELFAPLNRAGLVFINSAGGGAMFNLSGDSDGRTADIPISAPAAVYMVHSFSASDPSNGGTIAHRWLANGAFVYFGSMQEPYLMAFRTPTLVADLLLEGLPMGAACRMLPEELPPFANPWRLVYLGDPLYRPFPSRGPRRIERWAPVEDWPSYSVSEDPPGGDDPRARLGWALRAALDAARRDDAPSRALAEALMGIDGRALGRSERDIRDLVLADTLLRLGQADALRADLGRRPAESLSGPARRWLLAARMGRLAEAIGADDWPAAATLWAEIAGSDVPGLLLQTLIQRVGPMAAGSSRREDWRRVLKRVGDRSRDKAGREAIQAELDRLRPGSDGRD